MAKNQQSSNLVSIIAVSVLGAVALILAISLVLNNCQGCGSRPIAPSNAKTINITASGLAYAAPTQGVIYLLANGTGTSARNATANLTATLDALNKSIAPYINHNASYITTTYYNVHKPYQYCYYAGAAGAPTASNTAQPAYTTTVCNYNASNYYIAEEQLDIQVPNIANMSALLTGISNVPNVYVGTVYGTFSTSQSQQLIKQAYADALANATAQAEALVPGHVLNLTNIVAGRSYVVPIYYYESGYASPATISASSIYFTGKSYVTEYVTVQFSYR